MTQRQVQELLQLIVGTTVDPKLVSCRCRRESGGTTIRLVLKSREHDIQVVRQRLAQYRQILEQWISNYHQQAAHYPNVHLYTQQLPARAYYVGDELEVGITLCLVVA